MYSLISQQQPSITASSEPCMQKRSQHSRPTMLSGRRLQLWQQRKDISRWRPYYLQPRLRDFEEHDSGHDPFSKASTYDEGSLQIQDPGEIIRAYEKAFEKFQQTNCRVLAKAYIKLLEPRKQVNFPYNGRKSIGGRTFQLDPEETKPSWWPSCVRHREPDHLLKPGMSALYSQFIARS